MRTPVLRPSRPVRMGRPAYAGLARAMLALVALPAWPAAALDASGPPVSISGSLLDSAGLVYATLEVPVPGAAAGPRILAPRKVLSPLEGPAAASGPGGAPWPPGGAGAEAADGMAAHAGALKAALASETQARQWALRDRSRVTDAELRLLTDAIGQYETVAEADAEGQAGKAAWHGIARCEYRIGRFWAAHQALEKSYPDGYDALQVAALAGTQSMLADQLYLRGHAPVPGGWDGYRATPCYQAARAVYRAVVVNCPGHPLAARALLRYGICAFETGDLPAAEGAFRQVLGQYGAFEGPAAEARARLAETLLRQSRAGEGPLPPEMGAEIRWLLDEPEREGALARGPTVGMGPRTRGPAAAAGPVTAENRLRQATRDRDEQAAGALLAQAQRFLGMAGAKAKNAARFQLMDVTANYPRTEAAGVARSLLDKHFANP